VNVISPNQTKIMKTQYILRRLGAVLAIGLSVATLQAQGEKKKVAGPNGGRIIATVEPRAEFLVLPDRKVQITFLDKAGKAVAPAEQVVTVTAGERLAPSTLTFSKSGNALISNAALPKGEEVPTVVQIKTTANAKAATEKFNVDLSKCSECKLAEYACTCAH
jgi:hypothetical protein